MLTYNTMRFGTDTFSFVGKQALLVAKEPLNPNLDYTHIKNFVVDYQMPAGSTIRFAFWAPDALGKRMYKLNTTVGNFVSLTPSWSLEPNIDDVLEYGNTIDDLLAFKDESFTAAVRPVIALEGDYDSLPKVKLSAVFEKREQILEHNYVSHIHTPTSDDPPIYKILDLPLPQAAITGDGEYFGHFMYQDLDDNWINVPFSKRETLIGKCVKSLKIDETLRVAAINDTNQVRRDTIITRYSADPDAIVFGDTADLYSVVKNYFLPLKYCAVIVKHEDLNGAGLKTFAKFDPGKYSVVKLTIGTGTGESQSITLPRNQFIDVHSLRVYADDVQLDGVEFSAGDNSVTFTAPADAAITASFTYNLQIENWIELTADATQHDFADGLFTTRYYCSDVKKYGDDVKVSAVRLQFIRGDNGNVPRVHSFTAGWSV